MRRCKNSLQASTQSIRTSKPLWSIKAIQTLYDTDGINFDASIVGGDEITLFRNGILRMAFCWNIARQLNSDNNLYVYSTEKFGAALTR